MKLSPATESTMEPTYFTKLVLSVLLFAPGLILLATWLFVGLLALLEKTGVFESAQRNRKAAPPLVEAHHHG